MMCGIVGIATYKDGIDIDQINLMSNLLYHRGPDHGDVFIHKDAPLSVGLGYRRLSIIDLSPAGNQPMFNESGDIVLVYNGEIYNHTEIRKTLIEKGHIYRSQTDTETVIHAYEEYGVDCLDLFNGMFAFALYDQKKKLLLLARDRMGVKPLYYYWDGSSLVFSSELKALIRGKIMPAEIDPRVLGFYFSLCYIPSPYSIIKNVNKLTPGYFLTLHDRRIEVKSYWQFQKNFLTYKDLPDDQTLVNQTRYTVEQAIQRNFMSDVPVGILFSGGIDSTIIAAVAQNKLNRQVDTFTVGFTHRYGRLLKHSTNDDFEVAHEVSKQLGTNHHEVLLEDDDHLVELLPIIMAGLDEPMCETTAILQFRISQLARELGVFVLLTGDGSDELFAGYSWHFGAQRLHRYRQIPMLSSLLSLLITLSPENNLRIKANDLQRKLSASNIETYRLIHNLMSEDDAWRMIGPNLQRIREEDITQSVIAKLIASLENVRVDDQIAWLDLALWVREFFNHRLDRMSMLNSVEARVPFQDNSVVDFALQIPTRRKIHGAQTKILLRKAFFDVLPSAVLNRPKRPFIGPYVEWLSGCLKDYAREMLSQTQVARYGVLDPHQISALSNQYFNLGQGDPAQIWSLFIFNLWCQANLA